MNPAQFNQELFDIEQIEVLQGPQGAVYGRNAIGGAIVIRTRQPSDEFEGQIRLGVDNGFGYWLRGSISGPIGDTLRFRLAGSWYDTEGFLKNPFLGEEADPVEDFSLRGTLLWQAERRNFTADLRASMSRLRTQALYFNIVADVNDTSLPIRVNNAGQNDRDMYNVSLRLNWETDGGHVVVGHQLRLARGGPDRRRLRFPADPGIPLLLPARLRSQPEPVPRRRGDQPGDPLDLARRPAASATSSAPTAIDTNRFISTGNMVDTGAGVFPVFREPSTNPANPQATFLSDQQNNFAWAVFANFTYDITEQFDDRRSASATTTTGARNTTLTPTALPAQRARLAEGRDRRGARGRVRRLAAQGDADLGAVADVTLYGGYSRGFRSGGFNQTGVGGVAFANGIVGVNDIFQAETADTFEIGARASFTTGRLTLGANVYTTQSENSYFFVFLAANSTQNLGNVPEVRITGFELEARARPVPRPRAQRRAMAIPTARSPTSPIPAVIGNELPLISRYTLNLGAQYRAPIAGDLGILARVDYRRTGRTWWEPFNTTSPRPDRPGQCAARPRRRANWSAIALRRESVRRGIQCRILAGRLRVQGAAAALRRGADVPLLKPRRSDVPRILILYYSSYGHVETMAARRRRGRGVGRGRRGRRQARARAGARGGRARRRHQAGAGRRRSPIPTSSAIMTRSSSARRPASATWPRRCAISGTRPGRSG